MLTAIILLFLLIALLTFLLFTPITLMIDTYQHQYYVKIRGIGKCSLLWKDGVLIEVRVPFYRFSFDPFAAGRKQKAEKRSVEKKPESRRKQRSTGRLKKAWRVLRSFKIRQITIDLDTSDVIQNAFLYPIFLFGNTEKVHMRINYEGEVGVLIHIENNLVRMAWAYIK